MLKAQRQAAQIERAIRDIEARKASDDAKKPDKMPTSEVGAFGARLLACKTLEEARKLLGL